MVFKSLCFLDYNTVATHPIILGIEPDRGRGDVYFYMDIFLSKHNTPFEKPSLWGFNQKIPNHIFLELPECLNFNMELFAYGHVSSNDITEYVLLFKPWQVGDQDLEEHHSYLENFIYVVPARLFKPLLAHGISAGNFSIDELRRVRVIKNFNSDYFADLSKNWRSMGQSPIPQMGSAIAQNLYDTNQRLNVNVEYGIQENRRYLY